MTKDIDSRLKEAMNRWGVEEVTPKIEEPVQETEQPVEEPVQESPRFEISDESPYIQSPFVDIEAPLVMVTSGYRPYLGALISMQDGMVELSSPLLYIERPDGNNRLQIGFQKPYMALGLLHILTLRFDSIYLLNSGSEKDIELARVYANQVQGISAEDAKYSIPTLADIARYGSKKPS